MKRISILLLGLVLLFALAACGSSQGAVPGRNTEVQSVEPDSVKTASEQEKATSDAETNQGNQNETESVPVFNFETKTVRLNSGYDMPIAGLGTYALSDETCINSVDALLESGGRLIDTASFYGTEKSVGGAVRNSDVPREEILSLLVIMFVLMGSGIILSKHLFWFPMLSQGQSDARNIHLMMSYWGFVMMSFHTGLHGKMILNVMKRIVRRLNKQKYQTRILRCAAGGVAVYGVIAFIKRQLPEYMFLKIQYVFYDFNEPLFFFVVDYISIMLLFAFAAYYLLKFMVRGNS